MVFQVQDETLLCYQDIQGVILYDRVCPEENVSWTLELAFASSKMVHIQVDVYFQCILGLRQFFYFTDAFFLADIPSG